MNDTDYLGYIAKDGRVILKQNFGVRMGVD